jgi:hypothetical protein
MQSILKKHTPYVFKGGKGKGVITVVMYTPTPQKLTPTQLYKLGVYLMLTPYTNLFNAN